MGRVSDDDLVIDRHGDENQTYERRRATAYHKEKVGPFSRHKTSFR
jgi:hypothetical protein